MCLRDRGTEGLCHVWEASPRPRTTCDVWCCRAPPFCCEVRVRACPMPFPRGLAGVAPPCSGTGTRSDRRSPDFPGACGRGGEGDDVALGMGMGRVGGRPGQEGHPPMMWGGHRRGWTALPRDAPGVVSGTVKWAAHLLGRRQHETTKGTRRWCRGCVAPSEPRAEGVGERGHSVHQTPNPQPLGPAVHRSSALTVWGMTESEASPPPGARGGGGGTECSARPTRPHISLTR